MGEPVGSVPSVMGGNHASSSLTLRSDISKVVTWDYGGVGEYAITLPWFLGNDVHCSFRVSLYCMNKVLERGLWGNSTKLCFKHFF